MTLIKYSFHGSLNPVLLIPRIIHLFHIQNVLFCFTDESPGEALLIKGESVVVIGASTRRGHLVVEKKNHTIHVPFQYLELASQG
jgi:hypothetical protein